MDTSTCFKSLLLAIQQYREARTTQNAAQLQRQVEEFSALKCGPLLSSGQVLLTECMNGLVELAGNPVTSPTLTSTIISLLAQLACDDASREILHCSYNCTSTLAAVIQHHSTTPGEPLVLQSTNHIHELITFLWRTCKDQHTSRVKAASQTKDEIILPCLGLMANLCRDNHSVQSHIKSLLFDGKNIHQTFQLVFNIIVNGNGTVTRKYSVDLLVDLLKNPKIADYLTRYQHFTACVSQVLGLLHQKTQTSAAKVLELLLAMCGVSGLRLLLCEVVFRPAGPKLKVAAHRQGGGPDVGRKGDAGLALIQWLSSPVDGAESCSLQALQLLTELLEEALGRDTVSDCVLSFTEMLLPVLLGLLRSVDPAHGDARLRKQCRRIAHVSALTLSLLCAVDATRSLVSQQVSAQLCLSQAGSLLSCCHSNSNELSCSLSFSQLIAEALLKTLALMSKLKQHVKDMETSFYRMLQDQRIVTPLSLALTSHHRERVQRGLSLLFEATPLPDFPSLLLGESIAANNAYRQREAEPVKRLAVQDVPPATILDTSSDSSKSVQCLVDKLQTGLELQEHLKDSRISEIIDVYEQKLSTFTVKEDRLQDLLEAKAKALSQADRLIAQYRLQRAQAEAEACKLGSLLKEAERRGEDLQVELGSQVLEVERSKADMEELLQHNARLQRDSEEHQALKGAYNSLLNRFNESERVLKDLQAAHSSLSRQNDSLRKNHENLQLQHDRMVSALEEREDELRSLQSDLQQKNSDITGLRGELRAEEEKLREKERERGDLEETVEVLRKELNKTEQARKDASIKASSLELQKSQLEQKLKQKEDELSKHSAMISMIHSLSSGKMKCDVNLSL
ncbi:hypothetical protein fugu_015818 [Takifugu bimaculatus]|uniref:CIP2A N-terminal domain-containing protein n=1 Tax=Takifugu bimaculatus TaxID=433685 RepID=A0A4Z2BWC3_9TELE|nr:hypothetical protein fugu_015818 [Takifugu bimaculatus]